MMYCTVYSCDRSRCFILSAVVACIYRPVICCSRFPL